MSAVHPYLDKDDPTEMTPCICPRCGKEFELKLFWTGRLPAKKFCMRCDLYRQENRSAYSTSGNSPTGQEGVTGLPQMNDLDFMEDIKKTDRSLKDHSK